MEFISKLSDIAGLAALSLGIYLFFSDPMRRWAFFGYKPTALIIFYDPKLKKVLLIEHSHNNIWNFPQGGIYSTQINQVVDEILLREILIPKHLYKFYKTVPLGTIRRLNWSYSQKYYPGSISLLPAFLGKSYLACLVITDFPKIKKHVKLGFGISSYKILKLGDALRMIEPQKAKVMMSIAEELKDLR